MIKLSIPLVVLSIFVSGVFVWAAGLFILGWAPQFVGHAFEGKRPEFMTNWRFLFVGARWWFAKVMGRG